jgi:cysteinyl-tRNA synthetase
MALTLYNTLTRRKEPLQPWVPGQVHLYCCGVTVYDYCHLGHARSYAVWDTLRRYLLWRGYQVRYVQNFTDIDDKILNRARQEGTTMEAISDRYTAAYFEDMARLNILEADEYPRATHTLDGIKRLIHQLETQGYAYAAAGDVYYRVDRFGDYGKLSGRKLEDLQAGASGRVTLDPEESKKENPFDFALWKAAKPGEPAWESPWGSGRPGWHIECSAMVRDRLGDSIDIHMGGADLIFPHHENEIAQSEAATGQPLARHWLHNGMINVGGEKMSKSLGNFTTIRDLLDPTQQTVVPISPMALRLFILQAQYRKPMDFTDQALQSAWNSWLTLKSALAFGEQFHLLDPGVWALRSKDPNPQVTPSLPQDWELWDPRVSRSPQQQALLTALGLDTPQPSPADLPWDPLGEAITPFNAALDDDLNTPVALAVLFSLAKALIKAKNLILQGGQPPEDPQVLQNKWRILVSLAAVLGLYLGPEEGDSPDTPGADAGEEDPSPSAIEAAIADRLSARKNKNWAEADRIRQELQAQGIILTDHPNGATTWHRA